MHENVELSDPVPDLETLQEEFTSMIRERAAKDNQTLKVHKDADFSENPMERAALETPIKVTNTKFQQLILNF